MSKKIKNLKKLIIIAQPSKKGFLWELALEYEKQEKNFWNKIEILDLYDKENFQPNLEFQDMKILNDDPNREKFQKKIKDASELIFIFPIWWWNMPAIMKNFIDTNFEAWFAYKFQKGSPIPKKLLKWRTAKVFCSCDGSKYMYNNYLCPMYLRRYIEIYILGIFWIELTEFEIYDKMRKNSRWEKDEILNNLVLEIKRENMTLWFSETIKNLF